MQIQREIIERLTDRQKHLQVETVIRGVDEKEKDGERGRGRQRQTETETYAGGDSGKEDVAEKEKDGER